MSNAGGFKSLNRYYDMLAGNTTFVDSIFDSIETVTVGAGGQATISFTAIPATYKHLQIRAITKDTQASGAHSLRMQFNSDTGSNYTYHALTGDGSSASSGALTSQTNLFPGYVMGTTGTSVFAASIHDILDYANANKYKVIRTLSGVDNNGSGNMGLFSGLWINTNAITSITILPATSTNFSQYSSFALYGIRG
jgi:hypothetical protein